MKNIQTKTGCDCDTYTRNHYIWRCWTNLMCTIMTFNVLWVSLTDVVHISLFSFRRCNLFLFLTLSALKCSKQRLFYLINLTGQKRYVTELKWIWPVIVSGDSPEIISSPAILICFQHNFQKFNMSVTGIEIKEEVSQQFGVISKTPNRLFFFINRNLKVLLKFVADCHPSVWVSLATDGLS